MTKSSKSKLKAGKIKRLVKQQYAQVAEGISCCVAKERSCCTPAEAGIFSGEDLAKAVGYGKELKGMPESATESFAGCGNPIALASLEKGEVVLDLGSGAGLDAFLAAKAVGKRGKVIGVDMTPEMIAKARNNAKRLRIKNIEFRLGDIEKLPVDSESVDVVISNCVINLAPNKDKVFREAYRVLKPGGRMMVSDIVTEGKLPKEIREDVEAWAGCVAGALEEKKYINKIKKAGFKNVKIVSKAHLGPISSDKIEAYKPH
jgi:ubiquinone/menaquinone biosynthesis C-methylase UbiE